MRLESLKSLWFYSAGIYNGLPLDDRSALEQVLADRPRPAAPRDQCVFYPNCADVPEMAGPLISGRSYTIAAGKHVYTAEFAATGRSTDPEMPGAAGTLTLYVDDQKLGVAEIVHPAGILLRDRRRYLRRA